MTTVLKLATHLFVGPRSSITSMARAINWMQTEKQQKLYNQLHKAKITPLVIYSLGSGHTDAGSHRDTDILHESDFKK